MLTILLSTQYDKQCSIQNLITADVRDNYHLKAITVTLYINAEHPANQKE